MIPISQFASKTNHPLSQYFDSLTYNTQSLSLLVGDPTAYGLSQKFLPQQGYQIMKQSIINSNFHGYSISSGTLSMKQAVRKRYCKNSQGCNIFITHGSNMSLLVIMMARCNRGDEILVPQIGYPIYDRLGPAYGIGIKKYKLTDTYDVDINFLNQNKSEKTKFIYIINPGNPTGKVFSLNHMKELITFSKQNKILLVIDQVYWGQAFQSNRGFAQVIEDFPVITIGGIQKQYGVPGWSVSWIILHDRTNKANSLKQSIENIIMLFLHPNVFIQQGVSKILALQPNHKVLQHCSKIAKFIKSKVEGVQRVKFVQPQGTIYLSLLIDDMSPQIQKELAQQGLNVVPLRIMGNIKGVRFLTCIKEEMAEQCVRILAKVLNR